MQGIRLFTQDAGQQVTVKSSSLHIRDKYRSSGRLMIESFLTGSGGHVRDSACRAASPERETPGCFVALGQDPSERPKQPHIAALEGKMSPGSRTCSWGTAMHGANCSMQCDSLKATLFQTHS